MYHVDWQKVATEPVLQKLRDIAGSGNAPATEQLRPLVGTILGHAGGLPVAKTNWSEAQRTSVCKKLLLEGVGAVLCRKPNTAPPCRVATWAWAAQDWTGCFSPGTGL